MTVKTPISCDHYKSARGRNTRGLLSRTTRRLLFTFAIVVFINNVEVRAQAFKSDIDAWVVQDTIDPPPENALLFVGSSSIRFWERLAQDFADFDIIQRGFGGSQFSDLNRHVDQIVLPYDPAAIVVFEGTNDVFFGKSADTVFGDYQSFVDLVHSGQNPARDLIPIFYIGITPTPARWGCCRTRNSEVNSLIQQHAQSDGSLYYIDTPSRFLATAPDPDRSPSAALFLSDGLHLNQDGYDIWTEEIKPIVESVVPSSKMYRANVLHPAVGSSLLVDFGPSTSSRNLTLGPDERGHVWNNFLPENHGAVDGRVLAGRHAGNLVTTSGDDTGIGIVVTGEFTPAGGGLRDPDRLLIGDLAVESASSDAFVSDDTYAPGGFMLTGLDTNATYEFGFFASRRGTRTLTTEYLITGKDVHRIELPTSGRDIGHGGEYDGNDSEIAVVSGIRSNEFGQVFVDLEPLGGNQAYINAMEISVTDTEFTTSGDLDRNGILDVLDIDLLTRAVLGGKDPAEFDIDRDGNVDPNDRHVWVKERRMTYFGDADLDGEFNSGDLVAVFGAGEYEDAVVGNSGWAEGDWDGDGDFTSGDLVIAFQDGGYEQGPRVANAVPEPTGGGIVTIALALAAVSSTRRSGRRF